MDVTNTSCGEVSEMWSSVTIEERSGLLMTRVTMDKLEECAEWVLSYFDDDIERMRTYYENMLKSSDVYYNQNLKR